ncbi:MAG TPA: GtrA family protein, partial [Streptosporangiaceae bacterium]|nr:GtrA family protein [Streptosporangiaceae bacterium]
NSGTFGCDLGILAALHGGLHWPVPVSITLSYGAAGGLSYLFNRVLNFRSHGAVGPQVAVYTLVVVVNYLAWILGAGPGWPPSASRTCWPGSWRACARPSTCTPPCAGWSSVTARPPRGGGR